MAHFFKKSIWTEIGSKLWTERGWTSDIKSSNHFFHFLALLHSKLNIDLVVS